MSDRSALIQQLSSLTVAESGQLVKDLEEAWGVKAPRADGFSSIGLQGMPAPGGAPVPVQTEFNVELTSFGEKKVQVIKAVREATKLGLVEAKALVERAPVVILEGVSKDDAEKVQTAIQAEGGVITIK